MTKWVEYILTLLPQERLVKNTYRLMATIYAMNGDHLLGNTEWTIDFQEAIDDAIEVLKSVGEEE